MYGNFKREQFDTTLNLKKYRVDGFPVCLSWAGSNDNRQEMCRFFGTKHFGTQPHCLLLCQNLYTYKKNNLVIPDEACPLWNYKQDIEPKLVESQDLAIK